MFPIFLYLLYGLAFVSLGLILLVQARLPVVVLPRPALWLLISFAFLHGAGEWLHLGLAFGARGPPGGAAYVARVIALGLSFIALLQFAVELEVHSRGRSPAWRAAPATFALLTAVAATLAYRSVGGTAATQAAAAMCVTRYGLGLTGSVLAALALWRARRAPSLDLTGRSRRLLAGASLVFLAYALVTGIVVTPAPILAATWLNTAGFLRVTGVPVEVFRALCAALLAWLLSDAFVVETARARAEFDRLREEFISIVAHDLRAPIGTIHLAAELIRRRLNDDPARIPDLVERVLTSERRLDRMIADLTDASLIEARQLRVLPRPLALEPLICAVVEQIPEFGRGARQARLELPESLPCVAADPQRLEQILINLLSNAVKYSQPATEIVIAAAARADMVEVSVTNVENQDLDEKAAELFFSRFYRTRAASARAPGLGIGLYIAKGLVEAHGGRIQVTSEGGKTTFRFTLKRAAAAGR